MTTLSPRLAQFCDKDGNTILGSDSLIHIDGRWNQESRDEHARDQRERYRKNFRHLYDAMTHYVYNGQVRTVDCY